MREPATESAWWSRGVPELIAALGSSAQGLSSGEAEARLQRVGRERLRDEDSLSALRLLLRQFQSPLVLILIFAACISLAVRQWVDASIILIIVAGSALLGFSQEYRASAAVAALRRRLALTVRVVRDGAATTVPVDTVVPGDVVRLSAGNLVPADGLVLSARDFLVTESSLTGESFPVEKQPGTVAADAPLARRSNCVFLGSSVRSGTADVLVVSTGRDTAFGAIASRLRARAPETEFARGVRQFGYLLVRVMIMMVVFVLVVNQLLGRPVIESVLFAMALAVGISPELLPAIVSVTLSHGARAMSRRGVIVRRLEAIENLGSIDVFCTDKTGTLTEGVITLSGAVDCDGRPCAQVRRLAFLNSSFETGIDNPLDAAIVRAGERESFSTRGWRKIDEIPYDFLRRRLTIVVAEDEHPDEHLLVTKGAFSTVLGACKALDRNGEERPLDAAARQSLEDWFRDRGAEGFRVLALARRRVAPQARYDRGDETAMTLVGFLLFVDPPKEDAGKIVRNLSALGIRIKVITGDNRYVTAHLAAGIGLRAEAMLTGAEIDELRDEALWQRAPQVDLFVEVDPQQKERIVRALQRTGHAVGYLGDGINDAPALHAADVGISVDGAVDVARETADVILLERDLDVLRQGIEDGRRTFANTLKYISITTSANFGNMVSMALVTPLLPFLPLAAKQILLNNFLSDLPSVAISTDNVDADSVARPRRWEVRGVRRFMIVFGLISSAFDLLTFVLLWKLFNADEATFQTAWFAVSLLTELAVVLVLRSAHPALASRPSAMLLWTTVAVAILAVGVPYFGAPSTLFGFVPLTGTLFGVMLLVVIGYVLVTELAKRWFFGSMRNATGS